MKSTNPEGSVIEGWITTYKEVEDQELRLAAVGLDRRACMIYIQAIEYALAMFQIGSVSSSLAMNYAIDNDQIVAASAPISVLISWMLLVGQAPFDQQFASIA